MLKKMPAPRPRQMPLETLRKMVRVIKRIEKIAKANDLSLEMTAYVLVGMYESRTGRLKPYTYSHEEVGRRLGL
jgi:hypothetical protein